MADIKHTGSGFERHSRDRRHAERSKEARKHDHGKDKDKRDR